MKKRVEIRIPDDILSYDKARSVAKAVAQAIYQDSMLVSWFDKRRNQFYPPVTCCDLGDGRASWEIYADSRGARLQVDINEGEYIFLFI